MIGIIIASRGMMFSKTMESVWENAFGKDCKLFMSHGLPIPECFNKATERAIEAGCDKLWFVEEDMIIPKGTLDKMLKMKKPVVTVDYADRRTGRSLVYYTNDKILFAAMGCLLVDTEVIKKIGKPYFKKTVFWIKENGNGEKYLEKHEEIKKKGYGTQDVTFYYDIRQLGYDINLLERAKIGHMMLVKKGKDITSGGVDKIEEVYLEE